MQMNNRNLLFGVAAGGSRQVAGDKWQVAGDKTKISTWLFASAACDSRHVATDILEGAGGRWQPTGKCKGVLFDKKSQPFCKLNRGHRNVYMRMKDYTGGPHRAVEDETYTCV